MHVYVGTIVLMASLLIHAPALVNSHASNLQTKKIIRQASDNVINQRGLNILNAQKCGSRANVKVSGGEETKLGEFPWIALIKFDTDDQPFKCGGSLITERYVLTAAHCFVGLYYDIIGVRLGEHNLRTEADCVFRGKRKFCLQFEDFGVTSKKAHPLYQKGRINNDIALIKLDRNVEYKRHIKPVCLPITPSSRNLPDDQRFYIAGWGTTEDGNTSDVPKKAIVQKKSHDYCRNVFPTAPISDNHICAAGEGIIESCRGDSGGPLFFLVPYKNNLPRFTQYGIVSFGGARCGRDRALPGVYASLLDMLPWITQNID